MADLTVTEGLAEIKLTHKKLASVTENARQYVVHPASQLDPLAKSGGSTKYIKEQLDSLNGLSDYLVQLRSAIAASNMGTLFTIRGVTKTVQQWLEWKREAGPKKLEALHEILEKIQTSREDAARHAAISSARSSAVVQQATILPEGVTVNLDESALLKEIQELEELLAVIDGQLNQVNAQTKIKL